MPIVFLEKIAEFRPQKEFFEDNKLWKYATSMISEVKLLE